MDRKIGKEVEKDVSEFLEDAVKSKIFMRLAKKRIVI